MISSLAAQISAEFHRPNVVVGRASLGLYHLLKWLELEGYPKTIALPSFLCHSPIAAVLAAGWKPVFIDINIENACLSYEAINSSFAEPVGALLYVHMFGNTMQLTAIEQICRKSNVFLIEDACQSYGWLKGEAPESGMYGDASLISFGKTKIIDVGSAGSVLSEDQSLLSYIDAHKEDGVFLEKGEYQTRSARFVKNFYRAKEDECLEKRRQLFFGILKSYTLLLYRKSSGQAEAEIIQALVELPDRVSERIEKLECYLDNIPTSIKPVGMDLEHCIPWRFVVRIPGCDYDRQKQLAEQLRQHSMDVSCWYLPGHWYLEPTDEHSSNLKNTSDLSQQVFQFWIDSTINEDTIVANMKRFCDIAGELGLKVHG